MGGGSGEGETGKGRWAHSSGLSLQDPEAGALRLRYAEHGSSLAVASRGPVPGTRLLPLAASAFSCIPVPFRLPLLPLGKV